AVRRHRRIVVQPLPGERSDPRRGPAAAHAVRFHDEAARTRLLVEVHGGAVRREGEAIDARGTGDRAGREDLRLRWGRFGGVEADGGERSYQGERTGEQCKQAMEHAGSSAGWRYRGICAAAASRRRGSVTSGGGL